MKKMLHVNIALRVS